MRARPVTPDVLTSEIADRIADAAKDAAEAARPAPTRLRVAVDGAPAARPSDLAAALVEPLRLRGHAVLRVSAGDFLRQASLRLEFGREDPDEFHDAWFDYPGLTREVLAPLRAGGSGRVLPTLWDPVTDRATRAEYVTVPPGGVLLLDGPLLLGRGLELDFAVHLWLSPAALQRRTADAERWTLPAYARYEEETGPARLADIAVRMDHPDRPALIDDFDN
ncbi:uridine kinase [Allostreptomyces psammosilenae]|uniref:Uridine kinase n=1 Tax=Allostreptomyces psammosilenae TaxID=1892865 RepID=A0A852ZXE8_9ACTN|nr:uridine kinase [Allostreptomyces psammosilenae]NYI06869.1 hypothetical protein [Allostreptomyces psammosilenae]